MKEISAIRAEEAFKEAQLAEVKLMEAEKHIGKIIYAIKASGFQAPSPKPTWSPIVVEVEGGMDDSVLNLSTKTPLTARHSVSIPGDGTFEVVLD